MKASNPGLTRRDLIKAGAKDIKYIYFKVEPDQE